ncbi:MAG: hypothetical protein AAB970_01125 [Patescibacteria group bacterium]
MKKIIVLIILVIAFLFFWFVPIIRVTIYGSGGLYDPTGKYNDSFQFDHYVTLKDYLFSDKIGY